MLGRYTIHPVLLTTDVAVAKDFHHIRLGS